MRLYLIASTLLALVIPLLKLPLLFSFRQDPVVAVPVVAMPLNATYIAPATTEPAGGYELASWIYFTVSAFFLLKFLSDIIRLVWLERKSRREMVNGVTIRRVGNIKDSFTFFNWIFLSERVDPQQHDYAVILKHEQAHAALGHTCDLIFFDLFKACFWWLPTAWIFLKEIKIIHEYQADRVAIQTCDVDAYSAVLISSTLNTNGVNLASSFQDGLIHKRLNAMKQQAKRFNLWKLAALTALCASLIVVLACSEEKSVDKTQEETFTIVESFPEFKGGAAAFNTHIMKEITYPKEARKTGVEGRVDVQFVVDKDGSISRVEVLKGIGAGCDEEAVRVVKSLPPFSPAVQHGKPVRVRMVVPLDFRLKAGETNPDNSVQGMISVGEIQSRNYKLTVEASYENGEWLGTVYDEDLDELPGAHVIIPGTTTGTTSALDGTFRLKAEPDHAIAVSFIGYETQVLVSNGFDGLTDPPKNMQKARDAAMGERPRYPEHQH
jgi:TonB family protein